MKRRHFLKLSGTIYSSLFFSNHRLTAVSQNTSSSDFRSFFVIGDWGTGGKFQREVANSMEKIASKLHPEWIISTGDNFYPDGVDSTDDPQWKTKWLEMYSGKHLQLPWYCVLGNHDHRKNPQAQLDYTGIQPRWRMPDSELFTAHSAEQATLHATFIDTQLLRAGKQTAKDILVRAENSLKQAHNARWRIAVGHHPLRSHGHYGDDPEIVRTLKPLFDKYNVHAYFCGHEHDLQTLKHPDDAFCCVVSGGGGGERKTQTGKNTLFAASNGGFHVVRFSSNVMEISTVNRTSDILYTHKITQSNTR